MRKTKKNRPNDIGFKPSSNPSFRRLCQLKFQHACFIVFSADPIRTMIASQVQIWFVLGDGNTMTAVMMDSNNGCRDAYNVSRKLTSDSSVGYAIPLNSAWFRRMSQRRDVP
jgi:hypothetical protein